VDFDNYKIFENVSGKHNISIFIKDNNPEKYCDILSIDKNEPSGFIDKYKIVRFKNSELFNDNNKINLNTNLNLFNRCDILNNHFEVSQGIVEATDKISRSALDKSKSNKFEIGKGVFVLNDNEIKILGFSDEEKLLLKPYLNTSNVYRYGINFQKEYLLYLGKLEKDKIAKGKYPNIKKHLDDVSIFVTSSNAPYGIHRTREQRYFEESKLICKGMFLKPEFYFDDEKYYCGFSFSVIIQKSKLYDLKLLLGIMNSKVGEYWFLNNGKKRGVGVDIGVKVFRLFPIPKINFQNETEKQSHDKIVLFVNEMLEAKKQLQTVKTDRDKTYYENKCNYLDQQIDAEA